jgi:hypothetical protein
MIGGVCREKCKKDECNDKGIKEEYNQVETVSG